MNYELTKQLKEAGYSIVLCEGDKKCPYGYEAHIEHEPTLSELIEACRKTPNGYLDILERTFHGWKAKFNGLESDHTEGIWYLEPKIAEGSTPEEAVANLWLELNKK